MADFINTPVKDVAANVLNATGSRAGAVALSALIPALGAGGLAWAVRKGLIKAPYAKKLGLDEIEPWRPALAAGLLGGLAGTLEFAPKDPSSLAQWFRPGWGKEYVSGPRTAPADPTHYLDSGKPNPYKTGLDTPNQVQSPLGTAKVASEFNALTDPYAMDGWSVPRVPIRSLKTNIWDTPYFSPEQRNFMFKAVDYGTGRARSGLASHSELQAGAEQAMNELPGDASLSTLLLRPAMQAAESAIVARGMGYLAGLSGNALNLATGGGAVYGLLNSLPTMRKLDQ